MLQPLPQGRRSLVGGVLLFLLAGSLIFLSPSVGHLEPSDEVELIKANEAAYPAREPLEVRGPIPGPSIEILSPPSDIAEQSPIRLIIRFQSFGGATVDTDSVRMTYEKNPLVDLTPRIAPYVSATGIRIDKARVPLGVHVIQVQVRDSVGRRGVKNFMFSVVP
jgi:hypothetical protein